MSPSKPAVAGPAGSNGFIPPLEPGDMLTREEFERRYEAMPGLKKAELIEGIVHMPSPVRMNHHGRPHARLIGWLIQYESATPGVCASDNTTARLSTRNEEQPDALLMILPACGGQARLSSDDYIESAPELVAEVASSSVSIDRNTKLRVYERAGVREYIIWRVLDQEIDWFVLRDGKFVALAPAADGLLQSEVFPGLWLDPAALIAGDLRRVFAGVGQGTSSPEHARFVSRLQAAAASVPPPTGA